jgi:hypothetical protein
MDNKLYLAWFLGLTCLSASLATNYILNTLYPNTAIIIFLLIVIFITGVGAAATLAYVFHKDVSIRCKE